MASFEPAVVELGKIVGPLKVDDTPKGQFYLVAKQIHEELARLVGHVKTNSAKDMILSARTVTTAVNGFVAKAQAVSDAITARANRENMMSHALQVKHFGVQMKMLLAVRAAGSAADASASGAEDSQLKTCVQGIVDEVKFILTLDIFKAADEGEDEDEDPFAGGAVQWNASAAFSNAKR